VGAEFTYIIAYTIQFTETIEERYQWFHSILVVLLYFALPGCIMKQFVNVMQLSSACYAVADYDAQMKNR
jgi:phosphate starvation-inducible membrane PsiE